jgi:hypothetical protein
MTRLDWALLEIAARLLEPNEREAALGDLMEAGEGGWQGLAEIAGLVFRRQAALWKNWRPWLAAVGLAFPGSLLLMGFSLWLSSAFQHFVDPKILRASGPTGGPGLSLLICQVFLLIGWSWTGGFVVGAISRRTLWVSIAACCLPCLFCLVRFREQPVSRFSLLLFLLPAIWGACQGLRTNRIKLGSAITLAVTITALMIFIHSGRGLWTFNLALIWPAWYLVATARTPGRESRPNLKSHAKRQESTAI